MAWKPVDTNDSKIVFRFYFSSQLLLEFSVIAYVRLESLSMAKQALDLAASINIHKSGYNHLTKRAVTTERQSWHGKWEQTQTVMAVFLVLPGVCSRAFLIFLFWQVTTQSAFVKYSRCYGFLSLWQLLIRRDYMYLLYISADRRYLVCSFCCYVADEWMWWNYWEKHVFIR